MFVSDLCFAIHNSQRSEQPDVHQELNRSIKEGSCKQWKFIWRKWIEMEIVILSIITQTNIAYPRFYFLHMCIYVCGGNRS